MNALPNLLVALLCLGSAGCGSHGSASSDGPAGLTIDLTGTWSGTWARSGGTSGAFSAVFDQNGPVQGGGSPTTLSGSASFEGFSCSAPMSIEAVVRPGGFVGPPSFNGTFTHGSITIQVSAIVFGTHFDGISGTYEVLAGSACAGETGTLTATIIAPPRASESSHGFGTQTLLVFDESGQVVFTRTIERHRD